MVQALTYGHNIFWGERYMDHGGPFHVTCLKTADSMQGNINQTLFRGSTKQVCYGSLSLGAGCPVASTSPAERPEAACFLRRMIALHGCKCAYGKLSCMSSMSKHVELQQRL